MDFGLFAEVVRDGCGMPGSDVEEDEEGEDAGSEGEKEAEWPHCAVRGRG